MSGSTFFGQQEPEGVPMRHIRGVWSRDWATIINILQFTVDGADGLLYKSWIKWVAGRSECPNTYAPENYYTELPTPSHPMVESLVAARNLVVDSTVWLLQRSNLSHLSILNDACASPPPPTFSINLKGRPRVRSKRGRALDSRGTCSSKRL